MISREDFIKLKRGDVVLYGRYNTPRIVEIGPSNYDPPNDTHPYITLSIMRRSWTRRIRTGYFYNDICDKISLPPQKLSRKAKLLIRAEQNERLRKSGFDIEKGLNRELKEHKHTLECQKQWSKRAFKCSPGYSYTNLIHVTKK